MAINYITVEGYEHLNSQETIEYFEKTVSKNILKLLDKENVVLDTDAHSFGLLTQKVQAAFTVYENKPIIVIFVKHMKEYFEQDIPKLLKGSLMSPYETLIKHELTHKLQWQRGDLKVLSDGLQWRGVAYGGIGNVINMNEELAKPYEVEAYLVSLCCGSLLDTIFNNVFPPNRKQIKILKNRYLEEFGTKFNSREYRKHFKEIIKS